MMKRLAIALAVTATVAATGCSSSGGGSSTNGGGDSTGAVGKPLGEAVTATIGPEGGTLATGDGRLVLTVPAGAVGAPTDFSIQPISNLSPGGRGVAYRLRPEGAFTSPVTLTFTASQLDVQGTALQALGIGYQDAAGQWFWVGGALDDAAGTITVSTTHFSDWSLLAGIQLAPTYASVYPGGHLQLQVVMCLLPRYWLEREPAPVYDCWADSASSDATWAVNGAAGGNSTVGTVQGDNRGATYVAPSQAPTPDTVDVTVTDHVGKQAFTLFSHILIGQADYVGQIEFSGDLKAVATVAYRFADAHSPLSPDFSSYNASGILKVASFQAGDLTCTINPSILTVSSTGSLRIRDDDTYALTFDSVGHNITVNCIDQTGYQLPSEVWDSMEQSFSPWDAGGSAPWMPFADRNHLVGSAEDVNTGRRASWALFGTH